MIGSTEDKSIFSTYRDCKDDSDDDDISSSGSDSLEAELVVNTEPSPTIHTAVAQETDEPVSPWRKSKTKAKIISELKNESSEIHLFIGTYKPGEYKEVNFKEIHRRWAPRRDKSNFRTNFKLILKNKHNKTSEFKPEKTKGGAWKTRSSQSAGWHLLYKLLFDSISRSRVTAMPIEELWKSSEDFQCYPLADFTKYYGDMVVYTRNIRVKIAKEESDFSSDVKNFPANEKTDRGEPFWYNHLAKASMEDDVRNGLADEMQPKDLYTTRAEYKEFTPKTFRKHVHQEKERQRASAYWRMKRNIAAQREHDREQEERRNRWIDSHNVDEAAQMLNRRLHL